MGDSNDWRSVMETMNLKHVALMVILLGLLVLRPLLPSALADAIFLPTIIVAAWLAGGRTRRNVFVTSVSGFFVIAFLIVDIVAHQQMRSLLRQPLVFFVAASVLGLLIYCSGVILHSLLTADRVSINEIVGTFNMYLIMGYAWSYVFMLIEFCAPGSFQPAGTSGSIGLRFIYFSFVTLTTIGFGDTIPVSPLAQMFVILEAIVGQFYVAIVVAYLVSMHIIHKLEAK